MDFRDVTLAYDDDTKGTMGFRDVTSVQTVGTIDNRYNVSL